MGKRTVKLLLSALLLFYLMILGGCDGSSMFIMYGCTGEIEELKSNRGDPEEIEKYDLENYHAWTFWYWSEGFAMTFTWGTGVVGCTTSQNIFFPIVD